MNPILLSFVTAAKKYLLNSTRVVNNILPPGTLTLILFVVDLYIVVAVWQFF